MNQSIIRRFAFVFASFVLAITARAQFTAFNDHFAGAGTHPNATAWNVYGTASGNAPGNAGPLKEITTGATLPVTITITNLSVGGGTSAGGPSANTPAFNLFNTYVDFGNGTVNHAVQTAPGQVVGRIFSGLDPNKRYRYSGTAARAGGYFDRWIRIALVDAQSYTAAHVAGPGSPGILTSSTPGASVAANEVALDTGDNTAGDIAVWDNIQPSPSGTFAVICTQYQGPVPGGSSAGIYGYSIVAEKLEEFSITPTPVIVTNSPSNVTVQERGSASFTVGVYGNPIPTVQWYRAGVPNVALANQTNRTLTINPATVADNGASFFAVASNFVTNVSFVATSAPAALTVLADTNAPLALTAFGGGATIVQLTFSEPITAASATNLANYAIANGAGPLQVTNAILAVDATNVTLFTMPQTIGSNYTVTISGIKDISAAANTIVTTQLVFLSMNFGSSDIGTPGVAGSFITVPGGFDITASGSGIGSTSDQMSLVSQPKSGDFDVRVRVAGLTVADAWSQAALMARDSANANGVFAASIATPNLAGSYFAARSTAGGAATTSGNFPANFPDTWLRLRRVGNTFTGFAGADGTTWIQLGSATLAVGTVNLGFAVSSHTNLITVKAQLRDYSDTPTNSQVVTSITFASEPLAACSRATQIIFSEIMYKPGALYGTNNTEYIEIYNSNPFFEDISGYRISGVIDYTFPAGTIIGGNQFLVIAKDPAAVQAYYGITGVLGPYFGTLPTEGSLRLRNEYNGVLLSMDYESEYPWPAGADETGHSLVMSRPSYGEADFRSWDVSARRGGSPGKAEPMKLATGLNAVVINEFLANTDLPQVDWIELYNHSAQPVDISGCWLSDDPTTNKFQVPTNTVLPPGGFVVFYETNTTIALRSSGEAIYLRSPDQQRMIDAVKFGAQETGITMGRYPDGGVEFYRLQSHTPGTNNATFLVHDVVINEIMYAPISGSDQDEYVELYNKGASPVSIGKWRFTSGVNFTFPANVTIPAGGYVVVAKNVTNMLARYANLNTGNTFGDYDGKLKKTDRVALAKPDVVVTTNNNVRMTNTYHIVVDEVSYRPGGHWGKWANEGGSSLELIDARSNHRMAQNWGDSDESQKAPWTKFEATGRLDQGSVHAGSIDRLELYMLDEGECLLDEVSVSYVTGGVSNVLAIQNAGFENGSLSPWTPQGNHINTRIENTGYIGSKSMRVVANGGGDSGPNRVRIAIPATLVDGQTNVTIKGVARWQRGWPELLLRLKGNYLEAYCNMVIPQNLGTPGLPNSRASANAAPAIADVRPTPILPAANEPTVITATVHDPDGLAAVNLYYRNDAVATYTVLAMNDGGTNGDLVARDGIYSATIPGQAGNTMIAFYVQANDPLNSTNLFPENATQQREAMLRFGDPNPVMSFGIYRLWLSTANINTWINRPAGSNQGVDGTFVVGNYRVIYNAMGRYGGSPYHQGQNTSPVSGSVHYVEDMPEDDMYLGTTRFNKIHAPGNGAFDDTSLMREQISFWFVRKLKLPYLYRRYVAFYCNGTRKGGVNALMEDSQRPGAEMIDEYFPDENEGHLFKEQPWFEWDDVTTTGGGGAGFTNKRWCQLTTFYSTNNAHKIAAYRQTWLARTSGNPKNDYSPIFALTTACTLPTTSPAYWQNIDGLVDVDQWTRTIAVEHAVGNWDSFGNRNSQNLYGYKPKFGKWKQMIWDYNIVLGNSGSDGPGVNLFQMNTADPSFVALENYAPFRRAWLRGYRVLTAGSDAPMLSNNCYKVIDARYNAMLASGITPGTPASTVKTFVDSARTAIANTVDASDVANFSVANTTINASSNLAVISGSAPVSVTEIRVNGQSYPVTWTSVTGWTMSVPVTNTTQISVSAVDFNGQQIGVTTPVNINFSSGVPDPSRYITINEVMYNPLVANAEYVEIFNTHSNFTFDMSGWVLNGVDYTFPLGSYIAPRQFLVLVKDRTAFANTYGGTIPVFGVYDGTLQGRGERLSLIKPGTPDVVINRLRYEAVEPWPVGANGTGSSLQLVDSAQENARVANWSVRYSPPAFSPAISTPAMTNDGWRFVARTGNIGTSDKLIIYPDNAGTLWLDDFSLVVGTNAAVGTNLIRGGDFEDPSFFANPAIWGLGTNMNVSYVTNDAARPGGGPNSLRMVAPFAGSASLTNRDIVHIISPLPANQTPCTLSFWYFATNTTIQTLTVRILGSTLITTNISVFIIPSNYVPPQLLTPAVTSATPGTTNFGITNLPTFQPLWINELQADNTNGIVDNFGERDPWIELYNSSTNSVSLDGLYLSATYTNLTNYAFPSGITLAPREFRVIWCDAQTNQDSGTNVHANFRLPSSTGSIALSRLNSNGVPQVLDYVNYENVFPNRSFGSYPDGQPFDRQEFFFVTPRGTNNGSSAPLTVFINEWMASNTNSIFDLDNDYEDWFELYNPGSAPVNLTGYYLTDSGTDTNGVVTNKFQFKITTNMAHVIPAHGYLLVWADGETGQNMSDGVPRTDMHVNFSLAKGGEAIGLFAADGTKIDYVMFGAQADDVSRGRYPDGNAFITNFTSTVSPRGPNYLPGGPVNTKPSLAFIGNKQVYLGATLSFNAMATDSDVPAQSLTFSLDPDSPLSAAISLGGAFSWTPGGIGTFPATIRVTDNGIPQMSDSETIAITVLPPPQFTSSGRNGSNLEMTWGTQPGFSYVVEYKDDLNDPTWIVLQTITATGNSLSVTNSTTEVPARFFHIRVQ